MSIDVRLPGFGDDAKALNKLAATFGDEAVYQLIRLCRRYGGKDGDPGAEAMTALARKMVAAEQEASNVDRDTAKRHVADRLGYTPPKAGNGRANFYAIESGGRRPDPRRKNPAGPRAGK